MALHSLGIPSFPLTLFWKWWYIHYKELVESHRFQVDCFLEGPLSSQKQKHKKKRDSQTPLNKPEIHVIFRHSYHAKLRKLLLLMIKCASSTSWELSTILGILSQTEWPKSSLRGSRSNVGCHPSSIVSAGPELVAGDGKALGENTLPWSSVRQALSENLWRNSCILFLVDRTL